MTMILEVEIGDSVFWQFTDIHAKQVGAIASLHKVDDEVCALARVFVAEYLRGHGVGRSLVESVIEKAKTLCFKRMDVGPAKNDPGLIEFYRKLGFRLTEYSMDNGDFAMELYLERGKGE